MEANTVLYGKHAVCQSAHAVRWWNWLYRPTRGL